jgi:predicted transposase/invertase (TIGR01784 family)
MKLLDPRSDFLFKRLFADNPRLLMDLLNATLPLENPITEIEYLPAELLPYERNSKLSIVDVRCSDMFGRHFIVEMQMAFPNRSNMMRSGMSTPFVLLMKS